MSAARRAGPFIAALSLALVCGWLLYLCGRPLATSDLWWHLAMGEVYATQGPWPAGGDPLLFTAHADAPVQHEWLFGVAVYAVEKALGYQGLRALHVLLVAGCLALALSSFRRSSRSFETAALATLVFTLLASWRFVQLRPDLVSIPAALALHRLLLEPEAGPGARRIALAALLVLVWVNVHSLFAVGLLLLAAGLAGALGEAVLAARLAPGSDASRRARGRAGRLAAALALCGLASLANPRGLRQHLTFLTSSRESAIWEVADEWRRFDPLSWRGLGHSLGPGEWLLADLVLALALALAVVAGLRLVRRRSPEALRDAAPVHAALAFAGAVALLASVRFLWLAAFPLLYALAFERRLAPGAGQRVAALAAGACALLALAWPQSNTPRRFGPEAPPPGPGYLAPAVNDFKFHGDAVRFLEETGLEGRLFNTYRLGGYLGYRLAPRLRTFIDSRTEHYPTEVYLEYSRIVERRGERPGEDFRALLDRRGVDVFLGVGIPPTRPGRPFTAAHLEGSPGWLLVSRSIRHAIWLRRGERNARNLARVVAWYRREGVPFDPARGLDVERVLREQPGWAETHHMQLPGYPTWQRERDDPDPDLRFRARVGLARNLVLLGVYRAALPLAREATALRPDAKPAWRELAYALLRLGRHAEGLAAAESLLAIAPDDARSREFLAAARAVQPLAPGAPEAGARLDRLTL